MSIDKDLLLKIEENDPYLTEIHISPYSPLDIQDIVQLVDAFEKKNNSTVKKLFIRENNIDDEGVKILSRLKAIEYLSLDDNHITDVGAQSITIMTQLKFLNVSGNKIRDKGFEQLLTLPNLTSLIIIENPYNLEVIEQLLTEKDISQFKELLTGYDFLDERFNPLFVKESNNLIDSSEIKHFNDLTEFYIVGNNSSSESCLTAWDDLPLIQNNEDISQDNNKMKNVDSINDFFKPRTNNACAATSGNKDRSTSPFIK